MIIEDECANDRPYESYDKNDIDMHNVISRAGTSKFTSFDQMREEIENSPIHRQLQENLFEHLWKCRGQMNNNE